MILARGREGIAAKMCQEDAVPIFGLLQNMTVVCKICEYIEKYSNSDNNMLLSLYCSFDSKVGRYVDISKLSSPKQLGGDNLNTDSALTK